MKKASPSKGVICENFQPAEIARAYQTAGANAISVLTEEHYFHGSAAVLQEVRKNVELPILRKDFIIDEYQIHEARVIGADAILLIAAILDTQTMERFFNLAHSFNLDCLTEVHNADELESAVAAGADIIGINNRNLKTFEVNLGTTRILAENVPDEVILVSESGLRTDMDLLMVRKFGADAVLIGESFMRKVDGAKDLQAVISGEMQALRGAVE